MKRLRRILVSISLMILVSCLSVTVFAFQYEDYKTYDVTAEEKEVFLNKKNLTSADTEATGRVISNFAISEQGQIALYISGEDSAVNVYDSAGAFQYSLQFRNGGSPSVVFFEGEILSINFSKERYIASFDPEGNCLSFRRTAQIRENSDAYDADRFPPTSGQIGNIKYHTKRAGLGPEYSQFSIEDASGNPIVIYDATKEIRMQRIIPCGFIAFGVFAAVAIRKYKREEGQKQTNM